MNNITLYNKKLFENIKRIDEYGNEYWLARDLQKVLEYAQWRRFNDVINRAIAACEQSKNEIKDHFAEVGKIVSAGATSKKILDYKLSRYACYLIVQNGDPKKEVIALGQTYFAIQTRRQELLDDEVKNLTEDEKRLRLRSQVRDDNKVLNATVYEIGARTSKEFADFHNEGYKGLYDGETVKDIKKRKKLKKSENVLDHMGSTELAANWFRITQADETLNRNEVETLEEANKTHNMVGKEVRKAMIKISGVKPEDLPTPEKAIKQLENEEKLKHIDVEI